MSFDAGAIVGKLELDGSGFTSAIAHAAGEATNFAGAVLGAVANALHALEHVAERAGEAIWSAFEQVGHAADDAGEAAEKAGVSVEFLTGVGALAKDAGSSVEGLADALKFLNNNAADAADGNKETAKKFADIGVAATDSAGHLKGTEELFFDVADAIAAIDDPAKKVQAAMNLLGRGGTDMIAALNKGSGGIRDFAAQIAGLGGTIDKDLAEAGDKFGTLETIAGAAWAGIKRAVAEPILTAVAANFDEIVAGVTSLSAAIRAQIPNLLEFGRTLYNGVVGAFHAALPLFQAAWPVLQSLGSLLAEVVVPAFSILKTVIDYVTPPLTAVLDLINQAVKGISSLAYDVATYFNLPTGGAGGGGGSAGGGASGGGPTAINVTVKTTDSTGRIAEKIRAEVQRIRAAGFARDEAEYYGQQLADGLDAPAGGR